MSVRWRRIYRSALYVVESGALGTVGRPFDAQGIIRFQFDIRNAVERGRVSVGNFRGIELVGAPFGDLLVVEQHPELGDAVRLVEVADINIVETTLTREFPVSCADRSGRGGAFNGSTF